MNCPFCKDTTGYADGESAVSRRILATHGSCFSFAGLSPQVYPYVIIASHRHFNAYSQASLEERGHLFSLLDLLLESGLFPSGALTVFEHGDRRGEPIAGCIQHFHLHVIDSSHDLGHLILECRPGARPLSLDRTTRLDAGDDYLLAGTYSGKGIIEGAIASSEGCGSQYFRRMLAALHRNHAWDWRLNFNQEAVERLKSAWAKIASTEIIHL